MSALDRVDPETRALLERFGFDADRFERLRTALVEGTLSRESNVVEGTIEAPRADDVTPLPAPGDPGYEEARAAGVAALREGRIAHVVLAGGMATRFGGVVKAVVDVLPGRSFIDLALSATRDLERALGARVPTAAMTSFATDEVVRAHVAALDVPPPRVFTQFVSLRLERDGELFLDEAGLASPYAQGHGDLFEALRSSGALEELADNGVEHVLVANVDNLGARLDPAVVGMHLVCERPLTAEVARKEGDTGGAPARVDGRLRLVEGPCFPPDFDQDAIPVFNTNTALVALEAIREPRELSWLVVEKRVGERTAVQLEHLYHELSAHVPTTYLEVPRRGPRGRFLPVKEPEDLPAAREALDELVPPGDGS
jgi:UTP--glucose-1-phosphate uridylyltransferase